MNQEWARLVSPEEILEEEEQAHLFQEISGFSSFSQQVFVSEFTQFQVTAQSFP